MITRIPSRSLVAPLLLASLASSADAQTTAPPSDVEALRQQVEALLKQNQDLQNRVQQLETRANATPTPAPTAATPSCANCLAFTSANLRLVAGAIANLLLSG
jgi:uncharacterized protein YlxW (UPF0749 family)